MKKITFSCLILPFFVLSCGTSSTKIPDTTYKFINNEKMDKLINSVSPAEVEKVLSREIYMAGGNYHISAFPYTHSYIEALSNEQARLKGLNSKEKEKFSRHLNQSLVKNKLCFNFKYSVLRFNQVSRLKSWKIFFFDNAGNEYPLSWKQDSMEKAPIVTFVQQSGDKLEKWLGDGVACTTANITLSSGFSLKVIPQYVQFPFDSYAQLYWDYSEGEQAPGKKQRGFKSYRGY